MANLPYLPPLEGDLLLDVFTHSSLDYEGKPQNEAYGDNKRLADLGAKVLDMAITQRLFNKKPLLRQDDIAAKRIEFTSDVKINEWVTEYQLKKRLKFAPAARTEIDTPEESVFLLHAYVGAAFCQRGLSSIQNWIDRLILPDPNEPPHSPSSSAFQPPQPAHAPPALPTQSVPGMTLLAMFNQTASQNGYSLEWPAESSGPAHQLRWTVKCMVSGQEKGHGTGRSQKQAKEEAAKMAFTNMGWNHF